MSKSKREYTDSERLKIINYIIENEGFYSLRGNSFWIQMGEAKIIDRTWQSMKEHFRMKIVNNLRRFDVSKEDIKKILAGYNNTRTYDRNDRHTTRLPKHNNLDFSDEDNETEKKRSRSTSSDDSDNLVVNTNPSTSKKGFKKQIIKSKGKSKVLISDSVQSTSNNNISPLVGKSKRLITDSEPSTSNNNLFPFIEIPNRAENKEKTANDANQTIDAEKNDTPEIVILDSPSPSPSLNVSSTNIDEGYIEISSEEEKKFLESITKYDSNLINCASIVTFIKQYADNSVIRREWIDLYDRFVEILNNLHFYNYLEPETLVKLYTLKDPLEKYRSDGFQEPKIEIIPIKVKNETLKFTLAPDPDLIYVKKESLELVILLEKIRNTMYEIVEKASAGEISPETASNIIKSLTEFEEKYAPQRSIDENQNCDATGLTQFVKQEPVDGDHLEIKIKEEVNDDENEAIINNTTLKPESISINMSGTDQSNISEAISLQPEITLNFSEIQDNSVQTSQYLEPLTTEELNVTNMVGQMIEEDLNQTDLTYLTCESNF